MSTCTRVTQKRIDPLRETSWYQITFRVGSTGRGSITSGSMFSVARGMRSMPMTSPVVEPNPHALPCVQVILFTPEG